MANIQKHIMAKSVHVSQMLVRTISPGMLIFLRSTVKEDQISIKCHQDRVVTSEINTKANYKRSDYSGFDIAEVNFDMTI